MPIRTGHGERLLSVTRGRDGIWRRGEGDEEGVALRVDLDAAVALERLAQHTPVFGQRLGVALGPKLVQQLRRTLDVGEEKRDGAGRERALHRRIFAQVTPREVRITQGWPARTRKPCTRRSTSSSRGPRTSCRRRSGRSTSTASTRTSASSCRSWSRSSSAATSGRATASTTRSRARERRWSRRTSSARMPSAATSRPSTACWRGSRRRGTRSASSSSGCAERSKKRGASRRRERPGRREWLRRWYAPQALARAARLPRAAEQLAPPYDDVAGSILSRAARSARLTTHFDLDFPRAPAPAPYCCHKHKRDVPPGRGGVEVPRAATPTTRSRRLRAVRGVRTSRAVDGPPRRCAEGASCRPARPASSRRRRTRA